ALLIIVIAYLFRAFTRLNNREINQVNILLIILLITQISLGIATVISSVGQVPVGLGVAHQFGAIALVGLVVYLNYCFYPGRLLTTVDK
ncbi:MAG: COX15/CtaA family protein, partial [Bacteroidota bacterium]